jgi:hypothetical protein
MPNLQKYKYGSFDLGEAEKEERELQGEGAKFLKFKVGKTKVRFLPPVEGGNPFLKVEMHYINLPTESNPVSFACPRKMEDRECPACNEGFRLKGSKNKLDQDKGYQLLPKKRVYVNAIDREEPEKGVQIAAFGKTIYEAVLKIRKDEDAGGDFTDPTDGFDIIIERTGTGKNDTEYAVFADRKTSGLGNMDWLEQQHDLSRFAKAPRESNILAMLRGDEVETEGEEDAPQPPARQMTGKQQKHNPRNVEDDVSFDGDEEKPV